MMRFFAAIALTCLLSASALAGDLPPAVHLRLATYQQAVDLHLH